MVFLDAGQQPDEVQANVTAWLPKVRPGGLLMGHDAFTPGTQDVLCELLGEVIVGPGSLWSHRVPAFQVRDGNGEIKAEFAGKA